VNAPFFVFRRNRSIIGGRELRDDRQQN